MTIILPLEPQDEAKLMLGQFSTVRSCAALDRNPGGCARDSRFRIVRDVYGRRPGGGNAGFALQRDES